jgi:hypothetical protein
MVYVFTITVLFIELVHQVFEDRVIYVFFFDFRMLILSSAKIKPSTKHFYSA